MWKKQEDFKNWLWKRRRTSLLRRPCSRHEFSGLLAYEPGSGAFVNTAMSSLFREGSFLVGLTTFICSWRTLTSSRSSWHRITPVFLRPVDFCLTSPLRFPGAWNSSKQYFKMHFLPCRKHNWLRLCVGTVVVYSQTHMISTLWEQSTILEDCINWKIMRVFATVIQNAGTQMCPYAMYLARTEI
jgi:hypothetical protein